MVPAVVEPCDSEAVESQHKGFLCPVLLARVAMGIGLDARASAGRDDTATASLVAGVSIHRAVWVCGVVVGFL